ncbi:MAG: hypothetical protein NTX50_12810 [Candidatus Sumerlaeota bacterium]|nr:hypothetical protein [Candidatus Sumerlaeota bacterium]
MIVLYQPTSLTMDGGRRMAGLALNKLYKTWSADVDADCRKLGIEPPMPKAPAAAKPATAIKKGDK